MTLKSSFTDEIFWGDWRQTDCRQFIPSKIFCGLFEFFGSSATSQAKLIGDKPVRINGIVFEIFEASLPILPCGLHDNSAQTPGIEWIVNATAHLRPLHRGNLLPYRLSGRTKKTWAPLSRNPRAEFMSRFFSWTFANRKSRLQYQGYFYKRIQIGEADTKPPARQWTASIRGRNYFVQTPSEFSNSLEIIPFRTLLIEFKLVCCKAAESEISLRCWVKPKSNCKLAWASLKNCCLVPVSST